MDCFTTRKTLAAIRADSDDCHDSEFALAAVHLSHCPQCQAAFQAEQEFDREFARACLDIHLPHGLHERLLAALALGDRSFAKTSIPLETSAHSGAGTLSPGESSQQSQAMAVRAGAAPLTQRARRFLPKRLVLSLVAAACVVIGIGLWLGLQVTFPQTSIEQVLELATSPEFIPDAAKIGTFRHTHYRDQKRLIRGRGENMIGSQSELAGDGGALPTLMNCPEGLRRAPVLAFGDGSRRAMGSVRCFQVAGRPRPFQVLLVLLDQRSLSVQERATISSSFAKAQTIYKNGDAARVWKEGNRVYICIVKNKGAEGFDLLAPQANQA